MAKKLKAPKGTDEANVGGASFRVDNDHTITLPDGVDASPLLERGGFTEILAPADIPAGQAFVRHDDPTAATDLGVRHGDGFLVPAHAVADLVAHGFRAVEPAAPVSAQDEPEIPAEQPAEEQQAATEAQPE